MSFTNDELAQVRRLRLPDRWATRLTTKAAETARLLEPSRIVPGQATPLRPEANPIRELLFACDGGKMIAISEGTPSKSASVHESLIKAKGASLQGDLLEGGEAAIWLPYPPDPSTADRGAQIVETQTNLTFLGRPS